MKIKTRTRVTVKYLYHRKCLSMNRLSAEGIAGLFDWVSGDSPTEEDYGLFHRTYAKLEDLIS